MINPVQDSSFAATTRTYQKTGDAKTDAFFESISSAAEIATTKRTGKSLGMTTIPYSDMLSYGMSAGYSDASTEEDPIVQVHAIYGCATMTYDVHVKQVNPSNASQLEMFALCCYTDDQGITERGSFGSYSRMKVFARNAYDNGYGGVDFQDPDQLTASINWTDLLQHIATDYFNNPLTYAQGIEARKLAQSMKQWEELLERVDNSIAGINRFHYTDFAYA